MQDPRPPAHARIFYKAVAVSNGRYLSIFDGHTDYPLFAVRSLASGIWVSPSIYACVTHARSLPGACALIHAPRVILRVHGWNADGVVRMRSRGNGNKVRVTSILPSAVLPYSSSPALPLHIDGTASIESSGISAVGAVLDRPRSAPGPRPPDTQLSGGAAFRMFGQSQLSERLQAQTAQLHEDVQDMEAALQDLQQLRSSMTAESGQRHGTWVQRALARSGQLPIS
mmetsp:Transcript_33680/g.55624  ORF Transcript_33680/g.55624 Transcript_33680/m.55624 type:complete len:227 (+) Transcript_33680:88-768(+)